MGAHGLITQLKVTLKHIRPPIWRRIEVPADITMDKLHLVLQRSLGWTNSHLHQFAVGRVLIGMADPESEIPCIDERKVRLDEIAGEKTRFRYEYDFGDGWDHDIYVERIRAADMGAGVPRCLDGKRACPPEDCGGVGGYEHLLAVIADPKHEEHDQMMEWLGGGFDPEAFDLAATDARLRSPGRRDPRQRV